jgi:hypothetical protein
MFALHLPTVHPSKKNPESNEKQVQPIVLFFTTQTTRTVDRKKKRERRMKKRKKNTITTFFNDRRGGGEIKILVKPSTKKKVMNSRDTRRMTLQESLRPRHIRAQISVFHFKLSRFPRRITIFSVHF